MITPNVFCQEIRDQLQVKIDYDRLSKLSRIQKGLKQW